jgi:hypothetical protein
MPQVIRKGQQPDKLHQTVSTPVVILAVVVVLAFLVFMVDRFITPIVPRNTKKQEEEAWQRQLKRMQESMPQGGWASPVPGMPPVYVPPKGQSVENIPPPR